MPRNENFIISAKIRKKKYGCEMELSDEENKIFTDLGLKNCTKGEDSNEINEYNKSVIQNFDAKTLKFFNNKTKEIIQNYFSGYELYKVVFETIWRLGVTQKRGKAKFFISDN